MYIFLEKVDSPNASWVRDNRSPDAAEAMYRGNIMSNSEGPRL